MADMQEDVMLKSGGSWSQNRLEVDAKFILQMPARLNVASLGQDCSMLPEVPR